MNRRRLLAAVGTLTATTGCLANYPGNQSESTDESVSEHFDGEVARPDCERESESVHVGDGEDTQTYETARTVPYPDPPTDATRSDVVEYVESFEHAYVTKDALCSRNGSGHVFRVHYDVLERETFDWYEDVDAVFLLRRGAASHGSDGDGTVWVASVAAEGVVYAVDESGVARVEHPGVSEYDDGPYEPDAPDPLESGRLVATFE